MVAREGPEAVITEAVITEAGLTGSGEGPATRVPWEELPRFVADRDRSTPPPRWVWADSARTCPALLSAGVRVARVHDLRLAHAILTGSTSVRLEPGPDPEVQARWQTGPGETAESVEPTLLDELGGPGEFTAAELAAEYGWQQRAVDRSDRPGRLRLLLAAESAGALVAAEMRHDGLPWDEAVHDETLRQLLGPRPRFGGRPAKLEELAGRVRAALGAPTLNPDSPVELLQALHRAGIEVTSTARSELAGLDHPVTEPLLAYKLSARLLSANGWAWMETWVSDGRFRPEYIPAGVVTGRWASRGGGALQLPKQIRRAVRADPGWRLVVADAAQLEPRVLSAMAADEQMAAASRGGDLYQALVDQGVVDTRAHAKVAMLGALYGATTGQSGQLMPRLARAFPRAIEVVEDAARAGERFEQVSTWLGRSSPLPSESWQQTRQRAGTDGAGPAETTLARRQARDWGRFTRNFVVQGSAAEWALCWIAGIRTRLRALEGDHGRPHLVYFLHDEVIVHTPAELSGPVEQIVRDAAADAGRLLFGRFPVEFALDLATVDSYDQA